MRALEKVQSYKLDSQSMINRGVLNVWTADSGSIGLLSKSCPNWERLMSRMVGSVVSRPIVVGKVIEGGGDANRLCHDTASSDHIWIFTIFTFLLFF